MREDGWAMRALLRFATAPLWQRALVGAVIGAVVCSLLPEIIRWFMGKGFYQ